MYTREQIEQIRRIFKSRGGGQLPRSFPIPVPPAEIRYAPQYVGTTRGKGFPRSAPLRVTRAKYRCGNI